MMNRLFAGEAPKDMRLDLVIMRESSGENDLWVAQCLQYDLCAQASTLDKLRECVERVLVGTILLALEKGETPFANLKPAPTKYWDQFRRSTITLSTFPVSAPSDRLPGEIALSPSRIPRGEALMCFAPTV